MLISKKSFTFGAISFSNPSMSPRVRVALSITLGDVISLGI